MGPPRGGCAVRTELEVRDQLFFGRFTTLGDVLGFIRAADPVRTRYARADRTARWRRFVSPGSTIGVR
jgi:hypothetical protein